MSLPRHELITVGVGGMGSYAKKVNKIYLFILIIAYVVGVDIFVYLKMLGLKELNEVNPQAQETLLPLSTCMGFIIALSIALMEFYVFNQWKTYSFNKFIFYKYSIIIILVTSGSVLVFIFFALFVEKMSIVGALSSIRGFLETEIFLSVFLYLMLFSIILNMIKTIYDYLGPQAITGALLGKYNQPAEEDLTFLFIDMQSSTSIAERMGHVQYSHFIRSSFQLLTESIHQHKATIYQFVGDEVVLLWPTATAQKTLAPIKLYFDFINKINQERNYFIEIFGEPPRFKAAIHSGLVTVTEIHTIKKDIVYHGDVLNTCARILEQCSVLNKNLLVSSTVADWIQRINKFIPVFAMQIPLRGKIVETSVYEIHHTRSS